MADGLLGSVESTLAEASDEGLALPVMGSTLAERYRLIRPVGSGGMGVVFEAEHVLVGRRVALKMLRPTLLGESTAVRRFRHEASFGGRVKSPHVVPIHDYGTAPNGLPFMVMDLVDGKDLRSVLASSAPLEVERALEIAIQICRGVEALHEAGIVHRDIKPGNVLVEQTSRGEFCRITDLGVAKFANLDTTGAVSQPGARIGTLRYMSPEQVRGEPEVDARSDIYGVGTILYEALCGEPPHTAIDQLELAHRVSLVEPERIGARTRHVPAALERIVHRAISKDPSTRFESVSELRRALEAFDAHRAGKARRASLPIVAAAVALLLAVTSGFLLARTGATVEGPVAAKPSSPEPEPPRAFAGKENAATSQREAAASPSLPVAATETPKAAASPAVVSASKAAPKPLHKAQSAATSHPRAASGVGAAEFEVESPYR